MLADELDFVIGVDTHRDSHALAVVAAASGVVVSEATVATSARGYQAALALADQYAHGRRVFAVEGSGSYGRGLTRFLAGRGERVVEVERPRRDRRSRAKSDALDAIAAARAALAGKIAAPRADGEREALRVLVSTREGAIAVRRAGLNQLHALVVAAPEPLRAELRSLTRARLLGRCARLRPHTRANRPSSARASSRCAAAPGASGPQPKRQASSSMRSSGSCGAWQRRCWPSRASVRSPPRGSCSPGHTGAD